MCIHKASKDMQDIVEDLVEPASIAPRLNSAIALTFKEVLCRGLQSVMSGPV